MQRLDRNEARALLTERERRGLTWYELSAESGIPESTLQAWQRRLRDNQPAADYGDRSLRRQRADTKGEQTQRSEITTGLPPKSHTALHNPRGRKGSLTKRTEQTRSPTPETENLHAHTHSLCRSDPLADRWDRGELSLV